MKTFVLALAVVLAPVSVFAQGNGEPPANVRMRIGPLFVNPTLALTNAGQDTNVFNDATDPKSDYTVTISPATDLWLRVGPSWVQGNIREDIVWFDKYASERSANNSYSLKWPIPLNRITITPLWSYVNTRDRPGFEIDTRAQRNELGYGLSLEYKLFTKTFIGFDARRATTNFAADATFRGVDLQDELNRTLTTATVDVRHQLTPLTSLIIAGSLEQDRFEFDPLRNSDSRSVAVSVKFDPAALLKGGFSVGYRDFKPASGDVPGYDGSTLSADLAYVLFGTTKFGVTASRDVQYSYDINQPYYIQTGGGGSIGQQLFGPLDVIVKGGLTRLDYRNRIGAVVVVPNRVDHEVTYGASIGYHFGRDTRIGINADHSRRDSALAIQQYQGWTYGMSVTYGSGS